MDNGVAIAVPREGNQYATKKLSELLAKDESVQELLKGRQQGGTGGQQVEGIVLDGVPFKVPADADGKTRSKLIKEHLESKGIRTADPKYSKEFDKLNKKIKEAAKKAA